MAPFRNILFAADFSKACQAVAPYVQMPTHGRGTLRRFLLGSVTAKMLHDLSCAVWTGVHWTESAYQPLLPYRSIVCAVDFHGEDAAVIRAAGGVAKAYGARLSVTHAVDWPASNALIEYPVYGREVVATALTRLVDEAGFEAAVSVVEGNPAEGVRKAVVECEGDLLVLGRGTSRKTVGRFWSNLYAIIRESPCPVLSV